MRKLLTILCLLPLVAMGQQSSVLRRSYAISNGIPLGWPQQGSNFITSLVLSNGTIYGNNALVTSATTVGAVIGLNGNDSLYDITFQGVGAATSDYQNVIAPSSSPGFTVRRVTSIANADGLVGTFTPTATIFVQDSSFQSHFDAFNCGTGGTTNARAYMLNTLFQGVYNTNVLPKDGVFGGTVRAAAVQGGTWYFVGCTLEARGSTNGGYNAALEASQLDANSPATVYLSGCRLISSTTNGGFSFLVNIPDDNTNTFVYSDTYLDDTLLGGLESVSGTVHIGSTNRILFPGKLVQSSKVLGSAQALITTVPTNVTSILVPKGDWDVEAQASFGGTGATNFMASISTTANTLAVDGSESYFNVGATTGTGAVTNTVAIARKRVNIATATTVYLAGRAVFGGGTVAVFGNISARRISKD